MVRGQQVLLDRDLALLYGVDVAQMNRQVKRNIERFPEDFMLLFMPVTMYTPSSHNRPNRFDRDACAVDECDAGALAKAAQVQEHHHGNEASRLEFDKAAKMCNGDIIFLKL